MYTLVITAFTIIFLLIPTETVSEHGSMAFAANPLSLGRIREVPEAAFEKWLRDSGYLQLLDDLPTSTCPDASPLPLPHVFLCPNAGEPGGIATEGFLFYMFSFFRTLASLLALNPFSKLSPEDFSGPTPSWTLDFVGGADLTSFSWPAGPSQVRMRVQENVRKYVRNYACLGVVVFACCLYNMPVVLLGSVSTLLLWDLVRFCSEEWRLQENYPGLRQALVRISQFATAVVLYLCNIQLAVICTIGITYAVVLSHAFFRKLDTSKQSTR